VDADDLVLHRPQCAAQDRPVTEQVINSIEIVD